MKISIEASEIKRLLDLVEAKQNELLREQAGRLYGLTISDANTVFEEVKKKARYLEKYMDFRFNDLSSLLLQPAVERWGRIDIETDHPAASDTYDHKSPRDAIEDTTRSPAFLHALERHLGVERLRYLDLGCSAGGLVFDALTRGHLGVGIEGSDVSSRLQRSYWRVCGDFLFTADFTKPFTLTAKKGPLRFHAISLWKTFGHLPEEALSGIFENIDRHLEDNGIIVGSIETVQDTDRQSGAEDRDAMEGLVWWKERFARSGFEFVENHDFIEDEFARGSHNPQHKFGILRGEGLQPSEQPQSGFHFIARRK